jgi:putative selenium metabolism hydrolase
VEENKMNDDRLLHFARALVQTPGLSGEEQPVVELILREMRALAFDGVWVDANGSAVGVVEGAQSGPSLLLDGHCDTVGIAPGSTWRRDPFSADVEDGRLHGRGSADMLGALAAMIYAVAGLDRSRLTGRVFVSATVMEEVMEGFSLATVMEKVQPDFVIIGEASDFNLNRGGRGRAEIHIETLGKPSHSSSPELGLNAVHEMTKVIQAVEGIELPLHPLLGPAIMALTDIISDPYPGHSVIPSRCRVTYDRRLLPGETEEGVVHAITSLPGVGGVDFKALIAAGEYPTYKGNILRGPKFFPAWEFEEDHPFVQDALSGLRSAGLSPQLGAYRFCTNAAHSAGVAGVPTVGFGPATEGDAHVVDEQIAVEALETAVRGYQGIIMATLGSK